MKWLIFIIIMIQTGYRFVLDGIKNRQRKKPLPIAVSDIYDEKRYESFLSYEKDYDHVNYPRPKGHGLVTAQSY